MTDTLTITDDIVGKYVKLRSGRKAYVSGIIPDEIKRSKCEESEIKDYSHFIGFRLVDDRWVSDDWKSNGRAFTFEGEGDIVALWQDEESQLSKK